MSLRFRDRAEAGRLLADDLATFTGRADVVVLGLPRGGIPVAFEVARKLHAPLAAFLVRKLGVPAHEELAMGAIASGGVCFLNEALIKSLGISERVIDEAVARERRELERREEVCCGGRMPELRDRVVILIDDGLATGASMRAAVMAIREHHPGRIIVAAPVAAKETLKVFEREGIETVCSRTPDGFHGVGQWYEDFTQTTDEEVRDLLQQGLVFRPAGPKQKMSQEEL
ncbi:MAG: phosphoribosyltransferase [Verrucomicrobiota bacterium]